MGLTDLREILRYVPRFRDRLFVIAIDGAVVEADNFRNLLLDIALLRSLRIRVALVHGAAHQIRRLATALGVTPSNLDGSGVTDQPTLELALLASARVAQGLLDGLAATDLRGAVSNALVAHPAGILQGIDHQFTGKVERVDVELLRALLSADIVPVVPPIGCDGEGNPFRLNSDVVAGEVARALQAVKVIYLTTHPGLPIPGQPDEVYRHLPVGEAELLLRRLWAVQPISPNLGSDSTIPLEMRSKLDQAVKSVREGVPRVHIIDGRVEEGLLAEVFSNEGIGTLIHANEYQAIRRAHKRDVPALLALIQIGVDRDELVSRSRADVESQIEDYFVFELDSSPAGCVALHLYPESDQAELACLCVNPRYENQGIGLRLVQYTEAQTRALGVGTLFCLSTQAYTFFQQKCGFQPGLPADLPPERRIRYERSGRRSLVLLKRLSP